VDKKLKQIVNFAGKINLDSTKLDVTCCKLMNVSKINELVWKETVSLDEGIKRVYNNYNK
jgi:GDP-L-fucose synthase